MRVTDIGRCDARPGRLVEWALDPVAVRAATRAPEDPRPPAYVQESHIRTALSVRGDGIFVPTWLGTVFDLPGRIDLDVLGRVLRDWTRRHETLRSGFRFRGGGEQMRRFTLGAEEVVLRRTEVGDFPDVRALSRHLQNRFDVAANALTWPNFLYAAVVRDDSTSVYLAFDHSNVDAYSIFRIPAEIHEAYAAGGRTVAAEPIASYVDFCAIERTRADELDETHTIVDRWRSFIARCDGRLPAFPVDLGLESGGPLPTQTLMREMLADDAEAAAFENYCRPFGGSLTGILAATALAVREIGDQDVYRTIVPFHTRVRSQWSDSVGWYVGGAPIEIPVRRAADFGDTLRTTRAALAGNRQLARIPLARVLRLLGSEFRPTSPDLYSIVSYADTRGVPGSESWQRRHTYGLMRVSYGDQVCVWVTRLHEGLQLACRFPETEVAHKNMRRYVDRLREIVTGAGSGGRRPGGTPAA